MSFDFKEILTTFMVLFAVIDIVGNIPIIIDLRKKAGHIPVSYTHLTLPTICSV